MRKQRELLAVDGSCKTQSDCDQFSTIEDSSREPPPYPSFPSRPTDDEMARLVKAAYDRTMEAFHEEMAAAKKKTATESFRGKRFPAAAKRS